MDLADPGFCAGCPEREICHRSELCRSPTDKWFTQLDIFRVDADGGAFLFYTVFCQFDDFFFRELWLQDRIVDVGSQLFLCHLFRFLLRMFHFHVPSFWLHHNNNCMFLSVYFRNWPKTDSMFLFRKRTGVFTSVQKKNGVRQDGPETGWLPSHEESTLGCSVLRTGSGFKKTGKPGFSCIILQCEISSAHPTGRPLQSPGHRCQS